VLVFGLLVVAAWKFMNFQAANNKAALKQA
jgi:hypothetical protein